MSKQLFEEALADVKQVKQVAEDSAKRAILDAVTPRIRDFIDQALLREEAMPGMPGSNLEILDDGGDESFEFEAPKGAPPGEITAAITPPDAEGKVTLDLDAICSGGDLASTGPGAVVPPPMFGEPVIEPTEEYEISLESLNALQPLIKAARTGRSIMQPKDVSAIIGRVVEHVQLLGKASGKVKATNSYGVQIAQMISHVEDMYDYVQESVTDATSKNAYETTLETTFSTLTKLQESTTMSKKAQHKGQMNEADLTLKLTGLPDDVEDNLDSVGVDLITGEEDGEEGAEGLEGGETDDLGDLDLDGGQGSQEGEDNQMENRRLSDDTIVEIDENMLRREIARMRSLREETKPASWGDGSGDAKILKNFGGGKDEGDPLDQDIVDLSPAKGSRPKGDNPPANHNRNLKTEQDDQDMDEGQDQMDESDDQMDESDDQMDESDDQMDEATYEPDNHDMSVDESDDLDQLQNRRKEDEYGADVQDGHATATWDKRRHEALRRLNFEKKLQERAQSRASALKKEAARAKSARNNKRLAEVRQEYATVAKRFNESLARSTKMSKLAAMATKKLQEARRSNSAAARPTESKAEVILRNKLAETNLFNAKLLFTNKLLQNDQLTTRQKAQVIKQLDEAATVREAKLIYTSLAKTLAGSTKSLSEGQDRQVLGSAGRVTRPASTPTLNEGVETERWATLAGITKR